MQKQKIYELTVHGKTKTYGFSIIIDPVYLEEYREQGLELDEILYTIPEWIVDFKLTRLWVWLQKHKIIPLEIY